MSEADLYGVLGGALLGLVATGPTAFSRIARTMALIGGVMLLIRAGAM